jgi:hypothetical protein
VFSVQPGAGHESNEELTSVGVLSSVRHRQQEGLRVFQSEILIIEFVSVDGFSSRSILVCEVTYLLLNLSFFNDSLKV